MAHHMSGAPLVSISSIALFLVVTRSSASPPGSPRPSVIGRSALRSTAPRGQGGGLDPALSALVTLWTERAPSSSSDDDHPFPRIESGCGSVAWKMDNRTDDVSRPASRPRAAATRTPGRKIGETTTTEIRVAPDALGERRSWAPCYFLSLHWISLEKKRVMQQSRDKYSP